jgi:CheY-like chemotaxis protein
VSSVLSNITLVIADDEAPIRMVVGERLRSVGFTVHEARDGEEALELVRKHVPTAIVTDLQMPYMNGLELCTAMRQDPRTSHIPALLLTARGHVLSDEMLSKTNIRRVMSKPFGVRELAAYVQETLIPDGVAALSGSGGVAGRSGGKVATFKEAA